MNENENNPYYNEGNNGNPYYNEPSMSSEVQNGSYGQDYNGQGYYNNGFNGQYNNGGMPVPPQKKGFAVTSMILGILSIMCCCSPYLSLILAAVSAVFGIISLVKKRGGKGMAIAGVVTSSVGIIMSAIVMISMWGLVSEFGDFSRDFMKAAVNQEEVVEEYKRTGELPDYLQKYDEGDWGEFWDGIYPDGFKGYFEDVFVYGGDRHHTEFDNEDDFGKFENNVEKDFDDIEREFEDYFDE